MRSFCFGVLFSLPILVSDATAQCATQRLPGSTQTNGTVRALAAMPDGGMVAVGYFTQIEGVAANRVARWNGTTWHRSAPGSTARASRSAPSPTATSSSVGTSCPTSSASSSRRTAPRCPSSSCPTPPPIVGLTFYHQMIPWEIGPAGIIAITATNALQLTAGRF